MRSDSIPRIRPVKSINIIKILQTHYGYSVRQGLGDRAPTDLSKGRGLKERGKGAEHRNPSSRPLPAERTLPVRTVTGQGGGLEDGVKTRGVRLPPQGDKRSQEIHRNEHLDIISGTRNPWNQKGHRVLNHPHNSREDTPKLNLNQPKRTQSRV